MRLWKVYPETAEIAEGLEIIEDERRQRNLVR